MSCHGLRRRPSWRGMSYHGLHRRPLSRGAQLFLSFTHQKSERGKVSSIRTYRELHHWHGLCLPNLAVWQAGNQRPWANLLIPGAVPHFGWHGRWYIPGSVSSGIFPILCSERKNYPQTDPPISMQPTRHGIIPEKRKQKEISSLQ